MSEYIANMTLNPANTRLGLAGSPQPCGSETQFLTQLPS
jgi:hypothetical protein